MVFQDAGESINPRFTSFDAIADPCGAYFAERRYVVLELAAKQCGLPAELLGRFPHQLSVTAGARRNCACSCGRT
jgi:peptide/nickel transport system ATP-binding protein